MKGIELSLSSIKKIIEIVPDNLSLEDIGNFTTIEYKNVKVRKKEFVQIIKVLENLIDNGFFDNISDSQLFFINFSNAISEFDVLTILTYHGKNLIVDIEVKSNREDVKIKLDTQMQNRIKDHLPQMFIDDNYCVIGYIENKFYKSVLKFASEEKSYNFEELLKLKNELSDNQNVYNKITISDNLSNIQNVYKKVKEGTFKLYASNKQTLIEINNCIQEGKKAILCLAKPGYGKTVLALNLFFNNENSKILILNQKFYNTFNMSEYYYEGRAFYGTDAFIESLDSKDIAVVDEAQRLDKRTLRKIIATAQNTIIFGDTGQAFMINDEFYSNEIFEEAINQTTFGNYKVIKLKESIRYPKEVDIDLRYFVDKSTRKDELKKLDKFYINIYNCDIDFFNSYNKISNSKKIFKMYNYADIQTPIIVKTQDGTYTYHSASRDFWSYAIMENMPFYGHTLHAISFDVENVFLYLDNLYYSDEYKMPLPLGMIETEENIIKYKNELNILLTRAKKSLHIYVEDLKSFLWFNSKLKDINLSNSILDD